MEKTPQRREYTVTQDVVCSSGATVYKHISNLNQNTLERQCTAHTLHIMDTCNSSIHAHACMYVHVHVHECIVHIKKHCYKSWFGECALEMVRDMVSNKETVDDDESIQN